MSSSTLSMVSCVLMFLILHHTKEVCSFTDQLPGKCGNDGSNKCVNAMQKKALLPEVKVRCACFDHPTVILGRKKHICNCRQDC
ncbi:hypothetical protein BRARA_H02582 [Brassica rapa]|uniref:Uncharacterized protein n=1 Tax=Brassica campestris TaxID=3711 RepID=A0A397YEQ6_BRACM|nr:hypothetical protein BRARA_H02582 [Brassica rapa]